MDLFLFSLKIAAVVTIGMAVLLAIACTPRLWMMWRRLRPVTLSLPCYDPAQLYARLGKALKMIGKPTLLQADGSFAVEPASWRRRFGVAPVTVMYSQPQIALITGQSQVLKYFARSEKLQPIPVPGDSFKTFLRPWTKFYCGFLGVVFAGLFLAIFIADPDHIASRTSNTPAPSQAAVKRMH